MTPTVAYVVCTTPRTGSGVLGEALWESGVAGRPDEYFNDATAREYTRAWGVTDPRAYVDAMLVHATTPNGVLGVKLMANQLPRLARFLPTAARRDPFGALDALVARLPRVVWIALTRRDRVRQAISYWKALHANAFASIGGAATDDDRLLAAFDAAAIDRLLAAIDRDNVTWRTYVRERALTPLPLVYEDDLHDSFDPGVAKVLTALGITMPPSVRIEVRRRPQTDALTEALVDRYRAAR